MNGGSSVGTTVADVAGMLVKSWSGRGEIAVRFSGEVRSGDPFGLVANAARLRALPFSFETSLGDGMADTVAWLKDQPA